MKTRSVYYCLYFLFAALLITSCKNDDSTEELVGNWVKRSDFEGVARSEAVSFVINGKSYVGLGYDGDTRLRDLWEYDLDKDTWIQKASLPDSFLNTSTNKYELVSGRMGAVAFSIGDKAYITTGYDNTNYLKDVLEYNSTTNTWSKKNDFGGTGRWYATAFVVNGKGYVGTGYDGKYLKDFWAYDPEADSWTQVASVGGSKRMGATSFVIDGKAYVVAGLNNGSFVTDFWAYDASADTWTEKNQITDYSDKSFDNDYKDIPRQYLSSFVIGSKAYITGGVSSTGILETTWEYDPATDLWDQKTSFQGTPRYNAVTFTLQDRGFVLTGRSSGYRFDDCWEFKPNDKNNTKD